MGKLKSLLLFAGALCALTASAQNVRINLYGGYTFADKFNFSGYAGYDQAKLDESGHFGAGLEVEFRPLTAIEIYYQLQSTTGHWIGSLSEMNTKVNVSYLMVGGLRYAGNDKVKGFGGLMLGAAFLNSDDVDATKFGIGGRLGLLVTPNERFGIRLGAQVLSVVQGAGGGMYFGTGGAGAGVTTYSSIYQFGLFGGVSISLGGGSAPARSSNPPPRTSTAPPPPPPSGSYPSTPAPGTPPPPPPPPPQR